MEIFEKYKRGAYLKRFKSEIFLLGLDAEEVAINSKLSRFFENKRITISYSEIQNIIAEIETHHVDLDYTVKVVVQKANFNKTRESINSGVTTKLAFLLRTVVEGTPRWMIYGLASCRYNSMMLLSVTKSRPLGYTVYLSLFDKDAEASAAVPTAMEKLMTKIANKRLQSDAQART